MIDGLILSNVRTSSPNAILAPTPIKLQKHVVSSMTTPTMISSTSYSSPNSTTSTTSTNSNNPSPTIDWTHERIIGLIKLYEKKSVLWNPSNPEYFHRDIRNMVYDDLVRELNIPDLTVNETKRKLENLRSYFRRETKKLQDHERKTNEKLQSRWPYYESLQFIHEFMSVKNESGAELGFAKNMSARNSSSYHLPTMKREHVTEECAVQVPMGSTSGTLDASAFHLANNADLVAVLKALQGPLAETAASCFGITPDINDQNSNVNGLVHQMNGVNHSSPHRSPNNTTSPRGDNSEQVRSETPVAPLLPQNLAIPGKSDCDSPGDVCKKRKLCERQSSSRSTEEADLCGDYGRTVAYQLRQMPTYDRDLCRLQIDQLIFNIIHKEKKEVSNGISETKESTPPPTQTQS